MSKKNKNIADGATEAEIVDIKTGKSVAELPLDKPNAQPDLEAKAQAEKALLEAEVHAKIKAEAEAKEKERLAALQVKLDAALKQHQEKASLAFELLKAVMSQKTETILAGTAFKLLVKNVYALTDAFKQEIDDRYTTEVQALSAQAQAAAHSDDTVSKTVN